MSNTRCMIKSINRPPRVAKIYANTCLVYISYSALCKQSSASGLKIDYSLFSKLYLITPGGRRHEKAYNKSSDAFVLRLNYFKEE